jgi:hypothetical protein
MKRDAVAVREILTFLFANDWVVMSRKRNKTMVLVTPLNEAPQ